MRSLWQLNLVLAHDDDDTNDAILTSLRQVLEGIGTLRGVLIEEVVGGDRLRDASEY